MGMGRWLGLLGVIALLACALAPAASAAEPPLEPTCAEGPLREGDEILGTPCSDHIVVPASVTYVDGGAGNDVIVAGPVSPAAVAPDLGCQPQCGVGSQTFEGGEGNDTVYGERGNDILRGNGGDDRLYGGIGDDQLLGGPGNDLLDGGFGADSIDGGPGSDFVRGGGTTDRIFDSGGNAPGEVDTLSYADGVTPGFGAGVVANVSGFPNGTEGEQERGVYLYLGPGAPEPKEFNGNNGGAPEGGGADQVEKGVFETIIGSPYADYIVGGEGNETIYGGGGADVIEGNGGVDHLYGGADGDDLDGGGQGDTADGGEGANTCQLVATEVNCPVNEATKTVVPRSKAKVSVGVMASGASNEIYLTASSAADTVNASYGPSVVTFQIAGASFQKAAGAVEEGCTIVSTTTATCPAGGLSVVTIAGLGGEDHVTAEGFPQEVPVTILGGEGSDTLTGGQLSEDVLVDGKGNVVDTLAGLGGDDALIHQGGADQLLGGEGNDLFLSTSICSDETINGEGGIDNSSWAKLKAPLGVDARLDASPPQVGEYGVGAPGCKAGAGATDKLISIEDLEGSEQADHLEGDAGPNQLLGHRGADEFFSGFGADTILANSEDSDAVINCGPDVDRAVIDIPHPGLYEDPAPVECESVRQGIPEEEEVVAELPAPPAVVPAPAPVPVPKPRRDTKPPRTTIARRPAKLVRARRLPVRVSFRFAASERSTFRCKLDRGPYKPCRSPRSFRVAAGRHTFSVFAIDAAGNRDRTAAAFAFHVVRAKAAHPRKRAHRLP
jgi:Ca2+-binding RTX toxin-like protein